MDIKLLKQLGNMDQIAGVRRMTLDGGDRMAEVYNAAGLRFSVDADRCLDLWELSYKGVNFSFHSKNGLHAKELFNPTAKEFATYWPAGMLATCGLASSGGGCEDETGVHPVHGRIGYRAVEHFNSEARWVGDDYRLSVSGEAAETRLFGRNLLLQREISTTLYGRSVTIHDRITNMADADDGVMMLYHINFGYPILTPKAEFVSTKTRCTQINGPEHDHRFMHEPEDGIGEKLYCHEPETETCMAGVINRELGLGAYLKFDATKQPVMLQWKNMKSHDYVLGIEPCNCYSKGRVGERENGTLPILKGYESVEYTVSINILDGNDEIDRFVEACR